MRAVSVKVNEVIGVAGFVVPGTRVDVVASLQADKDTKARTVVSNLQVLASGTSTTSRDPRTASRSPRPWSRCSPLPRTPNA